MLSRGEEKTRIVEFGRFAEGNAKKKGKKPGTFNFLGFTHFCTKSRKDKFKAGRRTDRSKFLAKVRAMNKWLKSIRNAVRISEWWTRLIAKLRGHYQYSNRYSLLRQSRQPKLRDSRKENIPRTIRILYRVLQLIDRLM